MRTVNIVTALPGEAAPIREAFDLRLECTRPFRIYGDGDRRLIVTGVGAELCATAVGFLAGRAGEPGDDLWINFGIAGHRSLAPGSVILADKVTAVAGGRSFYPAILFEPPCATGAVLTFDRPVTAYPESTCCEMEAAGFMTAATAVARGEFVHVLKVVSDNASTGVGQINRERVGGLMHGVLGSLHALIGRMQDVAGLLPPMSDQGVLEALLRRWRFTVAQSEQLRRLHRRHAALTSGKRQFDLDLDDCACAADVLARLESVIDALPMNLSAPGQS